MLCRKIRVLWFIVSRVRWNAVYKAAVIFQGKTDGSVPGRDKRVPVFKKGCSEVWKIISSPAGNRTPVSRVTGGDTYHYTTEELLICACLKLIMFPVAYIITYQAAGLSQVIGYMSPKVSELTQPPVLLGQKIVIKVDQRIVPTSVASSGKDIPSKITMGVGRIFS